MPVHFEFEAIGTKWVLDIHHHLSESSQKHLLHEIQLTISKFDSIYSRFNEDSFISKISKYPGAYKMPEYGFELFYIYQRFYEITDGKFTPLIGKILEDAGYDKKYSLKQKNALATPPPLHEAIYFDKHELVIKKDIQLDLGSSGKGHLIDIVSDFLKKNGFTSFIVDAGRDIYFSELKNSQRALSVGLENPVNTKQVIGVCRVKPNTAICCSSGNKRKWGKFHHIIDPHTLTSPQDVLATWVIAKSTILADTIATCLFFAKPETIFKHYDFGYVILYADFTVSKSENIDVELF